MPETDDLDKFINEILITKNLSIPNEEVRLQLVSDLKKRLIEYINRALIVAMPNEKISKLNEMLDNGISSDAEFQNFVESSGIDVKDVTLKTMLKFRSLYLETPQEREA